LWSVALPEHVRELLSLRDPRPLELQFPVCAMCEGGLNGDVSVRSERRRLRGYVRETCRKALEQIERDRRVPEGWQLVVVQKRKS
jgi:hypothetical protein